MYYTIYLSSLKNFSNLYMYLKVILLQNFELANDLFEIAKL